MADEDEGGFDEPTAPAWMATFGDLMSLLLTFFVLLMSFASMDVRRYAAVVGSMRDAFGTQKVHPGHIEAFSDSLVQLSDQEATPFLSVLETPSQAGEREQALAGRLKMTIREKRLERVVEVENTPRGVILRVPGQLLFEPASADLKPAALVFLREIAGLVASQPGEISVEGHTDATPFPGATQTGSQQANAQSASNWELSTARAVSTLRYLVEVGRIDPQRLRATGFGSTRPLRGAADGGDDDMARAQNRRVEFVFLRAPQQAALNDTRPGTGSPQTAAPSTARANPDPKGAPDARSSE